MGERTASARMTTLLRNLSPKEMRHVTGSTTPACLSEPEPTTPKDMRHVTGVPACLSEAAPTTPEKRSRQLADCQFEEQDFEHGGGKLREDGDKLREEFLAVLRSRRREPLPPSVKRARPKHHHPLLQASHSIARPQLPVSSGACVAVETEHLELTVESGPQGVVPMLVMRPPADRAASRAPECVANRGATGGATTTLRRPAIIFLHSTGRSKEMMVPFMQDYARRGYVTLAIDIRNHGDRAHSKTAYQEALVTAWKEGQTMPFIFDTVRDLISVVDYLCERPDVDAQRIGITGVSLGGMHAWFAAFADPRIAVVVPWIGVQNFGWAVEEDRWRARVASISHVFNSAARDMGKEKVDKEVVAAVWRRIAPGLMDRFDAPHTLPLIAPRPLLVLNGGEDPRCPVDGLTSVNRETKRAYDRAGVPGAFVFEAEEGLGHDTCPSMNLRTREWFDRHL